MATSPGRVIQVTRECSAEPQVRFAANLRQPDASNVGTDDRQARTGSRFDHLLFELGVEPSMTVHEAAAILRWSYWKARRYFRQVEGICVCYRPKRYKRPYRTFTIPLSIFAREWQKMT